MGEMFDALNQGMVAPPRSSNPKAVEEFLPSGWNGAPVTTPVTEATETGQKVREQLLPLLFPEMRMATAKPRDFSQVGDFFGGLIPKETRPNTQGMDELLKAFRSLNR